MLGVNQQLWCKFTKPYLYHKYLLEFHHRWLTEAAAVIWDRIQCGLYDVDQHSSDDLVNATNDNILTENGHNDH